MENPGSRACIARKRRNCWENRWGDDWAAFAATNGPRNCSTACLNRFEELASDRKEIVWRCQALVMAWADHIQEILKTGDYSLRAKTSQEISRQLCWTFLTLQSLGPQESGFSLENFQGPEPWSKSNNWRATESCAI